MKTRRLKDEDNIVCRHLLWDKQITRRPGVWREWLKVWHATTDEDDLIGLLHSGAAISIKNVDVQMERFAFYLSVADGWDEGVFRAAYVAQDVVPSTFGIQFVECPQRQRISSKAFEVLCKLYFEEWNKQGGSPFVERFHPVAETLLPILMEFFTGYSEAGTFWIRNVRLHASENHCTKATRNFLMEVIDAVWVNYERPWLYDSLRPHEELEKLKELDKKREHWIQIARVWSIDVLHVLMRLKNIRRVETLGPAVEKRLEEIALESMIGSPHVSKSRQVKNFQEALKAGSEAAWFLHEHRVTKACETP